MKSRQIAILAGSYAEYRYFCQEQGWPCAPHVIERNGERIRTVYCDEWSRMVGWMPDEFIRTGSWRRHPQQLIDEFEIFRQITEAKRGQLQRDSRDDADNTTVGC